MIRRSIARIAVFGVLAFGCVASVARGEAKLEAWAVDPLVNVLRDAAPARQHETSTDAARGEHATFQLVVRPSADLDRLRCEVDSFRPESDGKALGRPAVRFVGYVPVSQAMTKASDRLPAPGPLPDPLFPADRVTPVKAGESQAVWLTLKVPLDAAPGVYRATARLTGTGGDGEVSATVPLTLNVYAARVEKTRLWVTNWFQMTRGFTPFPEQYSDAYWSLLATYARNMAEHRQNVARTVPLELTRYTEHAGGRLTFDFSHMDRWVQTFIDAGVVGRIEGQQFGWRKGNWQSPYVVSTYAVKDGQPVEIRMDPESAEAERFYSQFLPALEAHLVEKGWIDRWTQHVADEPINENADSYLRIVALVRKYAPRIKLMDAMLTERVAREMDLLVPQLDHLHRGLDLFKKLQADGKELWTYTCQGPRGEYANRFIELPLIKTRLLPWINYRYGVTGYLHWGYNYWGPNPLEDPITLRPTARLPAGDFCIVYPYEGGVIDSLRHEAMRDGIVDHELLSQLAERDRAAADAIAARLVIDFNEYDTDLATFRAARRELLERLGDGGASE